MPLPSAPDTADSQGNQLGHETIIQRLNRKIGDDYFPAESFERATDWNGIPIVFASEHPDLAAFEEDPEAELKRIAEKTGRRAEIVGTLTNSRIEKTGSIRLMSDLVLEDDPEVSQLYNAGKLTGSTGFWANTESGSLKGSVVPNHFLLFEEDDMNQPRDKGVVILNKQTMKAFTNEGRVIASKRKNKLQEIIDGLKSLFDEMTGGETPEKPVTNADTVDPTQSLEKKIEGISDALSKSLSLLYPDGSPRHVWVRMTFPDSVIWEHPTTNKILKSPYQVVDGQFQFGPPVEVVQTYTEKPEEKTNMTDETVASKDAEIASLKEQLQKEQNEKTELANKIAEIEVASKDAAWKALKNKLPPGLVHTPEKEAETRKLFEEDSFAFTNMILEKKTAREEKEAGEKFTQKEDANDPVAIGRELRMSTGRIR